AVRFDHAGKVKTPARPAWGAWEKEKTAPVAAPPPGWQERSSAELEKALQRQKDRKGRIPLPGPDRLERIPAESKEQSSRVVWTAVSMGYQPALTKGWFDTMRTFYQEAKMDRVFANTYFWVITRSNECFY